MEKDELIRKLESLAQMDTDAVQVYTDVLEHVKEDDVKEAFTRFQGEHRYHAEQLGEQIVRLGGMKPQLKVDMMGKMADWASELRSMRGTSGALHAMRTAERYHNSHYGPAAEWQIDDMELSGLLKRFYDDEKRHLEFVEERLGVHAMAGGQK